MLSANQSRDGRAKDVTHFLGDSAYTRSLGLLWLPSGGILILEWEMSFSLKGGLKGFKSRAKKIQG